MPAHRPAHALAACCWRCSAAAACGFAFAKDEPKPPAQIGRFIRVTLPITGQTFERTRRIVRRAMEKAKKENARLVLIFEFDVPKGQKNFGRGSEFGAAHDLANFLSSDELNAVRTVAYLPAVDPGARRAGGHRLPRDHHGQGRHDRRGGHRREDDHAHAAQRLHRDRRPAADRARRAGARHARPGRRGACRSRPRWASEFVTPEGLAKLKKEHTTKEPVVVKRAGEQGEFSGSEARRLGFASYLAADRREVVKALELPPTAVEDDPSLEGGWRAGPRRSEGPDPRRFGRPGAADDRGANPRARRELHLPVDRQPRRLGGRRHAAGQLPGVRARSRARSARWPTCPARPAPTPPSWPWPATSWWCIRGRCWADRGPTSLRPTRSSDVRQTHPQGVGPAQGPLLVADGGDDRSASERLSAPRGSATWNTSATRSWPSSWSRTSGKEARW